MYAAVYRNGSTIKYRCALTIPDNNVLNVYIENIEKDLFLLFFIPCVTMTYMKNIEQLIVKIIIISSEN